jgi:hypothetical protein
MSDLTVTNLMLGMLFEAFGVGYILPAISGVILLVIPYVIRNNIILVLICGTAVVLPFIFRDL